MKRAFWKKRSRAAPWEIFLRENLDGDNAAYERVVRADNGLKAPAPTVSRIS